MATCVQAASKMDPPNPHDPHRVTHTNDHTTDHTMNDNTMNDMTHDDLQAESKYGERRTHP